MSAAPAEGERDDRHQWLLGSDVGVAVLAAYMSLHWTDAEGPFYPYLRALPEGCQMAICWDEATLAATFVSARVRVLRARRRRFERVAALLELDRQDYLEKISLALSREKIPSKGPARADARELPPKGRCVLYGKSISELNFPYTVHGKIIPKINSPYTFP